MASSPERFLSDYSFYSPPYPYESDYYSPPYYYYYSPPYYSSSYTPSSSSSSNHSSLSGGAIAGIVIVILVVVAAAVATTLILCRPKKNRKTIHDMAAAGAYKADEENGFATVAAPPSGPGAQATFPPPAAPPSPAHFSTWSTGGYYDPVNPQWKSQPSAPNSQGWQQAYASPPSSGPHSQGTQPPANPYMSPPTSGPHQQGQQQQQQQQQQPSWYSSEQQTTTEVSSYASGSTTNNSSGTVDISKPKKQALGFSMNVFNYEELAQATNGFSGSNILGQGGFGFVHKGVLSNGKEVAVKSLRADSRQGDNEFEAEIETVSRVHHRYLVSLIGYCSTDSERLLVYEYIPNGTLHYHLHGKGVPAVSWENRMKIALGSARGLAYLHEDCRPKIIHRDIKASNILLELDFEAKVADFGLAKFTTDQNTHVSTRVMGTFGYLAPEYAASGKLTEKSDVFSFGVMLLELITGRLPHDMSSADTDDTMVDWAKPLLKKALEDGKFDLLVDQKLENKYNREEMMSMIACASAAIRHSARRRPKMSQIVRALEGNMSLADLNDGVSPGQSAIYNSQPGYDTAEYKQDLERFRHMVAHGIPETDGASTEYTESYPSGSTSGGGHINRETEMGKLK